MNILLDRKYKKSTYTIGNLYIDGNFFCNTCEDKDRGLTKDMPLDKIKEIKISSKTAIPTGTYEITLNITSPKYSNYSKYKWAKAIDAKVPRLLNVPGFEGILMHPGNSDKDSSGCILVGENTVVGKVLNSVNTFNKLYAKLKQAADQGEKIIITIK